MASDGGRNRSFGFSADMKLYQRDDSPYWWTDLRNYGHGRWSTGLKDKDKAAELVFRYMAANGINQKTAIHLLGELIARYKIELEAQKKSAATITRAIYILGLFKKQVGDCQPISEIGRQDIEAFKLSRLQTISYKNESSKLLNSTVNRDMTPVRMMFELAIDLEWLDESPCRRVKRLEVPGLLGKPYPMEDIQKILNASPRLWQLAWLLFLYTGMRRSEGNRFTWDDYKGRRIWIDKTKEKQQKVLFVSDRCAAVIAEIRARMPKPYRRVLWWFQDISTITHTFKKYADQAGVGGNFHRLRHTFASHLINQGVDIEKVGRLLGQRDLRSTSGYVNAVRKDLLEAVEKLDFGTLVTKSDDGDKLSA